MGLGGAANQLGVIPATGTAEERPWPNGLPNFYNSR